MLSMLMNVLNDHSTNEQLRRGINEAQALDFDVDDTVMINKLAELYRTCISHLSPRIMVSGDPDFLKDETVAATIRAGLLGGLRSVVLWKQCGGSRPKLILARTSYVRASEHWLRS